MKLFQHPERRVHLPARAQPLDHNVQRARVRGDPKRRRVEEKLARRGVEARVHEHVEDEIKSARGRGAVEQGVHVVEGLEGHVHALEGVRVGFG